MPLSVRTTSDSRGIVKPSTDTDQAHSDRTSGAGWRATSRPLPAAARSRSLHPRTVRTIPIASSASRWLALRTRLEPLRAFRSGFGLRASRPREAGRAAAPQPAPDEVLALLELVAEPRPRDAARDRSRGAFGRQQRSNGARRRNLRGILNDPDGPSGMGRQTLQRLCEHPSDRVTQVVTAGVIGLRGHDDNSSHQVEPSAKYGHDSSRMEGDLFMVRSTGLHTELTTHRGWCTTLPTLV